MRRPPPCERAQVTGLTTLGFVSTTFVASSASVSFAYQNAALRASVETAVGMLAFLCLLASIGRARRSGSAIDARLAVAFGLLTIANLVFVALPVGIDPGSSDLAIWCGVGLRLAAAVAMAQAVWAKDHEAQNTSAWVRQLSTSLAVVAATLLAAALAGELPDLVGLLADSATHPQLVTDPLEIGPPLISMVCFSVASIGAGRRRRIAGSDPWWGWLAAGSGLLAIANAHYLLYPSLYTDRFYTGDLFRIGCYLMWFVAAVSETAGSWRREAVTDERRRLARDIHDGLAQELAFLSSEGARLSPAGTPDRVISRIQASADRALGEARAAIDMLARPDDDLAIGLQLRRAAEEVGDRTGVGIDITIDEDADLASDDCTAAVRILREAVTNAAKHAGVSRVMVEWTSTPVPRLRISDRGCGFDTLAQSSGFGITSMTERAAARGATCSVVSRLGSGTVIEVIWS